MAPLKGFTDHIFRNAFADHFGGVDLAVAPFLSSKGDRVMKKKYVRDVLPENNIRMPVIPQILSKNADDFTFLANYLYDLGYQTVNWNLGNNRHPGIVLRQDIPDIFFLDHTVAFTG